jgi:hypothetical protein
MEASFYGASIGNSAGEHFEAIDFMKMGAYLCTSLIVT